MVAFNCARAVQQCTAGQSRCDLVDNGLPLAWRHARADVLLQALYPTSILPLSYQSHNSLGHGQAHDQQASKHTKHNSMYVGVYSPYHSQLQVQVTTQVQTNSLAAVHSRVRHHMDPLGRRPLVAPCGGAGAVEGGRVGGACNERAYKYHTPGVPEWFSDCYSR